MNQESMRRRLFLGGVAGTLVGLSGCNGPSSPSEEDQTDGSTVTTPTDTEFNQSRDGFVVPVAAGLDESAAIDPNETSTPVTDAVDVIDENGDERGRGTILLPPKKIEQAEPVVPSRFISFLGWGVNTSYIEFTDYQRDGFRITEFKDGKFVSLDNFTIDGGERDQRTDGSAIHFINEDGVSPKQFNIGFLGFRDWIDPVVHCERGSPYDSVWGQLEFGFDHNDGREIVLEEGQSLLGTQIGHISAGNGTGDTVFYTDLAGAKVRIGFVNIGGSAGQAFRIKAAENGHLHVGGINFETLETTGNPIVSIQGESSTRFEYIQNTNTTVESMVDLTFDNGNNIIGKLQNNGTVETERIRVTDQSTRPTYYFGPSSDVTAEPDVSPSVLCFDDLLQSGTDLGATTDITPKQYSNSSPEDLSLGEFAFDTNAAGSGSPAFVYRDENGRVHYWEADGSTGSPSNESV